MEPEIIVVQSRGMEKWLRMVLAGHHGVSANLLFPFPNSIVERVFKTALGDLPEQDTFDPSILRWKIMKALPSFMHEKGAEGVRFYLGDPIVDLKWFQLSQLLADTYDQYAVFRPEMLLDWEKGKEQDWQARLWRYLSEKNKGRHRASFRHDFLTAINKGEVSPSVFPKRLSVFGVSFLPPFHLDILSALSKLIEINLFILNPCREYWFDIFSESERHQFLRPIDPANSSDIDFHIETGNSLLASMGKQGKDFLSRMMDLECGVSELFEDSNRKDMLSFIQSDILDLSEGSAGTEGKRIVGEDDNSIQIHSCHSPIREMETLYDRLLLMFEKDPDLMPQDILVMTPDIEGYSSLIQAVFGSPDDESKRIPFSIADRNIRSQGQITGPLLSILELSGSRFTSNEILSLLECDDLRKRFGLSETDISLLTGWVEQAGIRWGIDGSSRHEMGLPYFDRNSWRFGLERLLLGYAMPERGTNTIDGILPYDKVEGDTASLLGRFIHFAETLFSYVPRLGSSMSLENWAGLLIEILENFFEPDEVSLKEYQMIRDIFNDLSRQQQLSCFNDSVNIEVIKAYLSHSMEAGISSFGFISGGVTFCAMLPMRSIPFKVICLVGMHNEAYPRQRKVVGFDIVAKNHKRGDRSLRDEDRYLFLESLISARTSFYISYIGQGLQDNSEIPPCVLVSELTDYCMQAFQMEGKDLFDHMVTKHPLQAFSPAYFRGNEKLISYSRDIFYASKRAIRQRAPQRPFLGKGLSTPSSEWRSVDLNRLSVFLSNPARFLLRERLGIYLERDDSRIKETEPLCLDGLEKYVIEQLILDKGFEGHQREEILSYIQATGKLPPGKPGECSYERMDSDILAFIDTFRALAGEYRREPVEKIFKFDAFELNATVNEVYGGRLIRFRYGRLRSIDHLSTWLLHLALNARTESARSSILIGREDTWEYKPHEDAETTLKGLIELFWKGLVRPLKFFPDSSLVYAEDMLEKAMQNDKALSRAHSRWEGSEFSLPGERENPYFNLCFGDSDPLDRHFEKLSLKVYEPLLKARSKVMIETP